MIKKKCLVHARCCAAPGRMLATAQYLNISGSDLFSGILSCQSKDEGKMRSEFQAEQELAPLVEGDIITVGCDAYGIFCQRIKIVGRTDQSPPSWENAIYHNK